MQDDNINDEHVPSFYQYIKVPSAILSFLCSTLVVWHVHGMSRKDDGTTNPRAGVTRSRRRSVSAVSSTTTRFLGSTYHRILIGVCVLDMVASFTLTLESWLVQTDPVGHWTCSASGFLKVVGITCGSSYNAALATYFYVIICRNWRQDKLVLQRLELPWHAFIFSLVAFWTSGFWLLVYNPSGESGCWAVAYPQGCTTTEKDLTTFSNLNDTQPTLRGLAETFSHNGSTLQSAHNSSDAADSIPCTRGGNFGWIFDIVTSVGFVVVVFILLTCNIAIFRNVRRQESRNQLYRFDDYHRHHQLRRENSSTLSQPTETATVPSSRKSRRARNTQTARVATQSFLYCGGYLAVYLTVFLHNIATGGVQHYKAAWYPLVRSFQEVMFPLQGFFNALVYFHPRFVQWQHLQETATTSSKNRWEALQLTLSRRPLPTAGSLRRLRSLGAENTDRSRSVINIQETCSSRPRATIRPTLSREMHGVPDDLLDNNNPVIVPNENITDCEQETWENGTRRESRVEFAHVSSSSSSSPLTVRASEAEA